VIECEAVGELGVHAGILLSWYSLTSVRRLPVT
jgi:hypothetical protein